VDHHVRLDTLLNNIHQRWGSQALRPLRAVSTQRPLVPTGFPALDAMLGGGVPTGQVTELLGRPTSGKTTLAYHILARGQGERAFGIYIDLDRTFDPEYASRCGVCLERLFLIRPDTEPIALDIARELLAGDHAAVIVLDMGHALPDVQQLYRLRAVLQRSGCAVVNLITLPDGADPAVSLRGSPAELRLLATRQSWLRDQAEICGYRVRVAVLKSAQMNGRTAEIDIALDDTGAPR
jgi:hypothetical protein